MCICIFINSVKLFLFFHILSSICCLQFFNDCHSSWHEMVSQHGFNLHFSNDQWWWAFLKYVFGHIYVFFWEVTVHNLYPLFDGVVCFFLVNMFNFFVDSEYYPFVRWVDCKFFSHSVGCWFTLMIVYFAMQKLWSLIRSHLSILAFVFIAFGVLDMKSLPTPMSWMVLPRFSSRVFMVLCLSL